MPFKTYTYKTFGSDQPILADVHYGDNAQAKRQAIALTIHAGGFVLGKRDTIAPQWIKALTDRDFVVVSIDYRLCPQISLYDGPIQDTRDAYQWCRGRLPDIVKSDVGVELDGNRIVALGWSAGGHLSMMLGLEKEKPCAILNCYGPLFFRDPSYRKPVNQIMSLIPEGPLNFDEDFMNKIHDEPVLTSAGAVKIDASEKLEIDFSYPRNAWHFGHVSRGTWMKAMGIEGHEEMVDPALRLDKDFPPTFFLWGEEDQVVDVRLAEAAYEKLRASGVDTELVIAKGMGHAFGAGLVEGTEGYEKFVVLPVEFLKSYVDKAGLKS
ncbi:alpha/beta-hydrolase [Rhizodiscina lignyota]|uniref:Alpha/beta-hydrolase n=1 Tax=Rhizodiscina lignyota TaxID=1504668 RepID=A0A9P4M5U1_9PEZI|nr:alpha/beta-hydrolase [Rhizodiscina lignyota]